MGKPELIKDINLHTSLDLGRPSYLSKPLMPMLGNGILRANGQLWSFQRNLIVPEFFMSKIKVSIYYVAGRLMFLEALCRLDIKVVKCIRSVGHACFAYTFSQDGLRF